MTQGRGREKRPRSVLCDKRGDNALRGSSTYISSYESPLCNVFVNSCVSVHTKTKGCMCSLPPWRLTAEQVENSCVLCHEHPESWQWPGNLIFKVSLAGRMVWWVHYPCKTPGGQAAVTQSSPLASVKHHYKHRDEKRKQFHTWEEVCSRYGLEILLERVYFKRKRKGGKLDSNRYLESKKKKKQSTCKCQA